MRRRTRPRPQRPDRHRPIDDWKNVENTRTTVNKKLHPSAFQSFDFQLHSATLKKKKHQQ